MFRSRNISSHVSSSVGGNQLELHGGLQRLPRTGGGDALRRGDLLKRLPALLEGELECLDHSRPIAVVGDRHGREFPQLRQCVAEVLNVPVFAHKA